MPRLYGWRVYEGKNQAEDYGIPRLVETHHNGFCFAKIPLKSCYKNQCKVGRSGWRRTKIFTPF